MMPLGRFGGILAQRIEVHIMASLIITSGKQEGNYYPLGRRKNVIGRDEALPIQILDNMVSRKHLQVRFDEASGKYYAFDMKSRNGVYVNNERVEGERVLADGDVLLVGLTTLLFADRDFTDKESALLHYKKVGERMRVTVYSPQELDQMQRVGGPMRQGETGHPIQ
jgi:pSer/pThr/pTyr-binding forkhead associated (FHA) protein